ncbi:uncharacterized protein LOC113233935 [Hyposmocoma kahamanoa]|uniref:uncharacterized protein LOC113233935 n=1 Tax=Hyposmocoma kahamanoa TaxID=1477025 RepID=UPI000E6D8F1F|nr:uncharacterized protein LOC113233935 [Hyposmocoma kahamanoa]
MINSKDADGNDIGNMWNALGHINRTNVGVKTRSKIENNYDLEQEYLNEYVNKLDSVTQEDRNQAFEANIAEHFNSLENMYRPEKNIHNNIEKLKNYRDKHFIRARNVINNLVTKGGDTKELNLFDHSYEPVGIREANSNEQDSCMVTTLRREGNNYARKWESFNTTHEENSATEATYVVIESSGIEGVLRGGNSACENSFIEQLNKSMSFDTALSARSALMRGALCRLVRARHTHSSGGCRRRPTYSSDSSVAYLSKILHNLPRFNPIRLGLASRDFDLSIGNNYLPGVLLYGFPIFGVLVLYLMMWNSFCRRCSNKKQIFRRCDMWKVKYYKKMVAFCSFLSIVALTTGVYGAYFTHSDVCAAIREKIDPILDVLSPFLFQTDNLLNQLHKALDIAMGLEKSNTTTTYPHIEQIINNLEVSVSSYERHITTRRKNLTLLKDVESLIMFDARGNADSTRRPRGGRAV